MFTDHTTAAPMVLLLGGVLASLASLGAVLPASGQAVARKPVSELPSIKELPDPFLLADGSRVKSPEDWARRRKEQTRCNLA